MSDVPTHVNQWKALFPPEPGKPARTGPISSRPLVPARDNSDDPWRVGNQNPRRQSPRLANGGSISDYTYSNMLGTDETSQTVFQQNEYPSAVAAAAPRAPFQVTRVEGNIYEVQAGTCEGQLIATQEIDVGSTRPVAILAYPQYTLSIFNSEYVWAAVVKTGANAPVLLSSTSTLADVTTVTSSGTEARCLIAYIDTDNDVSQVTTGNIIGTFASSGTLTGQMVGSFNKNS